MPDESASSLLRRPGAAAATSGVGKTEADAQTTVPGGFAQSPTPSGRISSSATSQHQQHHRNDDDERSQPFKCANDFTTKGYAENHGDDGIDEGIA
jgi:hypothetical protein